MDGNQNHLYMPMMWPRTELNCLVMNKNYIKKMRLLKAKMRRLTGTVLGVCGIPCMCKVIWNSLTEKNLLILMAR